MLQVGGTRELREYFFQAAGGLAFTPDGRTLAVGNSDKDVYLWDVASPARPRPS